MTAAQPPQVTLEHLHGARVSVVEQVALVGRRLRSEGTATFASLAAGHDRLTVVVRFLAVLELFRAGQMSFEQAGPLSELLIRWSGGEAEVDLAVDEYEAQPDLEDA